MSALVDKLAEAVEQALAAGITTRIERGEDNMVEELLSCLEPADLTLLTDGTQALALVSLETLTELLQACDFAGVFDDEIDSCEEADSEHMSAEDLALLTELNRMTFRKPRRGCRSRPRSDPLPDLRS